VTDSLTCAVSTGKPWDKQASVYECSTGHNVSVPGSNEPRSKRAVRVVCNNQPCIAATKDASYCRMLTVLRTV